MLKLRIPAASNCGGECTEFNEQFNSGNAANWTRDSGTWNVVNSKCYTCQGVNNMWNTSTYNDDTYSNVDYSGRFWRGTIGTSFANSLIVRSGADGGRAQGRVGMNYWADPSGADKLWVDWAALSCLQTSSFFSSDEVSAEQQEINDAANANPVGDINSSQD